jgi:putative flippase GtrA
VARVRAWYRRWQTLLGEAWRFGLVGGTNVLINFLLFNALAMTWFSDSELKANVVATAFATTSSYLMNRAWTFRHRKTTRVSREYVLFFLFNGIGLGIELAVMGLVKYGLGLTALWAINMAKLGGLGLGTVFRFWTYRTFVFANPRPVPIKAEAEPEAADQPSVASATSNLTDLPPLAASRDTAERPGAEQKSASPSTPVIPAQP